MTTGVRGQGQWLSFGSLLAERGTPGLPWAMSGATAGDEKGFPRHRLIGLVVGPLQRYPGEFVITTAPFWDESIRYININFYNSFSNKQ